MDQRFLAETLRRRPVLFHAMVAFNHERTSTPVIPDEFLSLGELGAALWTDRGIRDHCTAPQQDIPDFWDFSEEAQRLLLLPIEDVQRLALIFSAAVHAENIARCVKQSEVLAVKNYLGPDIFHYALRRGRYQVGTLRQKLLASDSALPLDKRIRLLADTVLELLAANWPQELRTLWLKKLAHPSASPQYSAPTLESLTEGSSDDQRLLPVITPDQHRVLWFTLKKLLLKEAAPQWAPCFD